MGNKGGKKIRKGDFTNKTHDSLPKPPSRSQSSKGEFLTEHDLDFLAGQTGHSKDEIKKIFREFIVNNPDGKLDRKEFIQLYTKLRPEPAETLEKISNFVFRAFDLDQNGTIDFNEFMISYSLTTRGDLKQKLEYSFNVYDSDKNGYLDRDELKQVIFGMLNLLGADEKSNDANFLAQQCIRELDVSNDGKVSKEEFIKGLSKNYSMRVLLSPFN
ncbi:Neuronal calcium sensor 2 [Brachionus plicatilis]|uniref:Neuronal calcium sensor 2 n=1 Tax=Brachionus plicatilis TaxID=10195 RepID=A0A3M7S7S0_BRAPC|nr:Neuronal calcium sensor 2 [Brachionus plicatilis]